MTAMYALAHGNCLTCGRGWGKKEQLTGPVETLFRPTENLTSPELQLGVLFIQK